MFSGTTWNTWWYLIPIILHDNPRSHTAAAVTNLLRRWQREILKHPPCSPDMSPCDYDLFAKVKEPLWGTWYSKKYEHPCYRVANMEHQQRWSRWWCTTPFKHLASLSSAQGQIFNCKFRYQGYSSAQRQVFHRKLRNQVAVLLGMNRCSSFPLLSAPHSLFSIWIDLKRFEKMLGAPAWRLGEWIWLTGPSGLRLNSPQLLNISYIKVFDKIRDPEIIITLRPQYLAV